MSAKSMKDLEKPIGGAIFTNVFLSIAILFLVVGNLFKPLGKDPALYLVVVSLTLAVMYAIARTTPMYIYKIYTIPAGALIIGGFASLAEKILPKTLSTGTLGNIVGVLISAFFVYIL